MRTRLNRHRLPAETRLMLQYSTLTVIVHHTEKKNSSSLSKKPVRLPPIPRRGVLLRRKSAVDLDLWVRTSSSATKLHQTSFLLIQCDNGIRRCTAPHRPSQRPSRLAKNGIGKTDDIKPVLPPHAQKPLLLYASFHAIRRLLCLGQLREVALRFTHPPYPRWTENT